MPTAANKTPPASSHLQPQGYFENQAPPNSRGQTPLARTPDLPSKSPNRPPDNPYRKSRELIENPVSPIDPPTQNFSRPGQSDYRGDSDLAGNPVGGSSRSSGGTLGNLKAAAVGLHVRLPKSNDRRLSFH